MPITPRPGSKITLAADSKLAAEHGLKPTEINPGSSYGYSYVYLKENVNYFTGRVLGTHSGTVQVMSDEWATCWYATVALSDGSTETISLGYSPNDTICEVDIEPYLKELVEDRANALYLAAKVVADAEKAYDNTTPRLRKDDKAEVIRGRKIPIGSEVDVFWVGTVFNKFNGRREERAGVKLNGQVIWCAACNLEPIPTEKEIADRLAAKAALEGAKKSQESIKARYDALATAAA